MRPTLIPGKTFPCASVVEIEARYSDEQGSTAGAAAGAQTTRGRSRCVWGGSWAVDLSRNHTCCARSDQEDGQGVKTSARPAFAFYVHLGQFQAHRCNSCNARHLVWRRSRRMVQQTMFGVVGCRPVETCCQPITSWFPGSDPSPTGSSVVDIPSMHGSFPDCIHQCREVRGDTGIAMFVGLDGLDPVAQLQPPPQTLCFSWAVLPRVPWQ
jgi:hypothetical protein